MAASSNPVQGAALNEKNLKRVITMPQALAISFHQIVGGGVVSLTGVAIALTGGGIIWAYISAALSVIVVSIPYASLGAAVPVTGGFYTYGARLIHPAAGYASMWFFAVALSSLSLYGLAAGQYLHSLDPWFSPVWVAVVLICVFYVANLMGASISARIGVVLAVIMLCAFGTFIVLGLAHTHWSQYPPALPNGFFKLLQAAALLTFATGGGTVVAELGNEMKRPGRIIPVAVIGGTAFAGVLYALIALPAAGVLPVAKVANQPLSIVAAKFMPHSLWLFFILGGAVIAVIGTMNAQLLWGSKSLLVASEDGWFPKWVGSVNKRFGTPHVLLSILFIIGVVPALAGLDISVIGSAASALGQVSILVYLVASLRLRYLRPTLYAKSPFRLNLTVHWILVILGILLAGYQAYLLTAGFDTTVWISLAVWVAIGIVWYLARYRLVFRNLRARGLYGHDTTFATTEITVQAAAAVDAEPDAFVHRDRHQKKHSESSRP